jgi:ABC-type bacteriocin/lantibiotic exporter with double-glycine peptidase domain
MFPGDLEWAESRKSACGVNALYIMLRVLGRPSHLEDLETKLGMIAIGNTLVELRGVARTEGVESRISRCRNMVELAALSLPCIVLSNSRQLIENVDVGHFLVVVSMDNSHVDYVEATSGRLFRTDSDKFQSKLAGYALEPLPSNLHVALGWGAAIVSVACCALVMGYRRSRNTEGEIA